MSTICRKIANKRYKISFTTYLLAKLIISTFLLTIISFSRFCFFFCTILIKEELMIPDRNSYHCHTYQTNNTTQ